MLYNLAYLDTKLMSFRENIRSKSKNAYILLLGLMYISSKYNIW